MIGHPRIALRPVFGSAAILAVLLLPGCARYAALPLATTPSLAPAIDAVQRPDAPRHPLSVAEVVDLALANNPDLKAARLKRAIASGQTRQARARPNPSLSGALLPLLSGVGTVPAWNVALGQDFKTLLTYRTRRRAAEDSERQIAADVVWQEWQVAGQARQIASELIVGRNNRARYLAACQLLAARNAKLDQALTAHTVTLVTVAPDRAALQAARGALNALDQRQLALTHDLNALLGLAPDAEVPLATQVDLPPFDPVAIRAGLATLPDRRPDLIALRMGYAAADEQVRQAIQAQFPDLVLGASVSSDNSSVVNGGPTATLSLPVFDRNQGNVAITRATRAQLHADYAARLASTIGTVGAMLREMEQLGAQLAEARRDLPAARLAAERAQAAFGAANLDERGYVDLLSNRFAKEQDIMTLELALLDRQIALQTLVGDGLPSVEVGIPAQ